MTTTMDQIHTRAMDALQPFIHLANSSSAASPRFAANIITNATTSPHTYVFAELLERPAIQALRASDELQGYLTLLEIFAWGTWQDYQRTPNLPALNAEQTQKLRLLSLLSLSSAIKPLTYESLMESLSIQAPSDLESLVTTAIYSSLITARLSPATTPPTVNVTCIAPLRDVNPQSLPLMISTLTQWEARCGAVISDIETEIAKIRADSAQRRAKEHAHAALIEKTLATWSAEAGEAGGLLDASARGTGTGSGSGSKKLGWKPGTGVRGRGIIAGGGGNKREFKADDFDDDDGYWDNTNDLDPQGSGMDIDEGAGARTGLGSAGARHVKRILGKKS